MERETDNESKKSQSADVHDTPAKDQGTDNAAKDRKETSEKSTTGSDQAASVMSREVWADRLKPFSSPQDKALADKVEQWRK